MKSSLWKTRKCLFPCSLVVLDFTIPFQWLVLLFLLKKDLIWEYRAMGSSQTTGPGQPCFPDIC
jgi:hypothetical protein